MLVNLINILQDLGSNERSLYSALDNFFADILVSHFKRSKTSFQIIPEMSFGKGSVKKSKIKSFPDLTFQFKSQNSFYNIGWIEVKLPGDSLKNPHHKNQFGKYKENLENLIFTNLQEWQLWQWDKDGNSQLIAELDFDITKPKSDALIPKFAEEFLSKFFEYKLLKQIKTAGDLAFVLGRKTRTLRETLQENVDDQTFQNLKNDLNKTLLLDSGSVETREREFGSLLAETLTYSLFTAYLQASQNTRSQFEIENIQKFIPRNIPILKDLFEVIFKIPAIEDQKSSLRLAIDDIVENLKRSDFEQIQAELQNNEFGDPLIYFYEPFLENYDKQIKVDRGAFYTPKPAVDFIIKSVNFLLQTHFDKTEGLADKTITTLDPFTGTATFLLSQIDFILNAKKQEISQSFDNPELITKELQNVVDNHILQNLYAFEIMAGPYTIAHLKLTLKLNQENLIIPRNSRFKIFLTNTFLDPKTKAAEEIFNYFPSIPAESTEAQRIKNEQKIWVVIGNPPYNAKSQNPSRIGKGLTFAGELIESFKFTAEGEMFGTETKTNLDDDYIKSLGFAFWKIKQAGQGIVAFITNNSFLSGPTHRKMRYQILKDFDEVRVVNLHGDINEKDPSGNKGENIFAIKQPVSITFFVKNNTKKENLGKVFYTELIGMKKEQKLEILEKMEYQNLDWQELTPKDNYYFFVPKDFSKSKEYDEFVSIKDIFEDFGSGIKTERDKINIHFNKEEIQKVLDDFRNLSVEKIREKYAKSGADEDSRDWKVQNAKNDVCKNLDDENLIKKINYRPFDLRFIWYSGQSRGMVGTPSSKISQHFFQPNLGMVLTRQFKGDEFKHVFVSKDIQDVHFISDQNYTFPLFRYEKIQGLEKEESDKIHPAHFVHTPQEGNLERVSNFKSGIVEKFGFESDLDLFYYIYAVLHLPNYRTKYSEQLKIDFPKIPTPEQLTKLNLAENLAKIPTLNDKKDEAKIPLSQRGGHEVDGVFSFPQNLIQLGQNLTNLHLLGQNPLDANSTNYFKKIKTQIQTQNPTKFFGSNLAIEKIKFDPNEQKLWINATSYFASVSQKVWEYRIGGYQVLDKFLKSRKENLELTLPEIKHLLEVINCLTATIELLG